MSDNAIATVYGKASDSDEKFDYFVAATTGAILTYSLQSYQPTKLNLGAATLEPIALSLLFFSFFLGLLRIQNSVQVKMHNQDYLHAEQEAESLKDAFQQGADFATEPGTRGVFQRHELPEMAERYSRKAAVQFQHANELVGKGRVYSRWRGRLLLFGFGVLFLSKVLRPYFA